MFVVHILAPILVVNLYTVLHCNGVHMLSSFDSGGSVKRTIESEFVNLGLRMPGRDLAGSSSDKVGNFLRLC
jgi:hypothetical protein